MLFCCLLPRFSSSNSLVGLEDSVTGLSGGHCGLKGQLKIEAVDYQQTLAEKLHATSMADIEEAPMVKTYGSLKGISREDLAELKATLLASSRHLKPNPQSRHQGTARPGRLGKALPAAEDFRMVPVLDLQKHMPQAFSKIGTLLELATQLLGVENMAVILLDGNHEVTPLATGFITPGARSRTHGGKQWLLVPSLGQPVIVEDTLQDPRTCTQQYVVQQPYVRFYCSALLVASNGRHIGHICAMDKDLQPKDPNRSAILGNIAGLITRELEKDWAAQQQKQQLQQQLRGPKQPKPVTMSQQAFMIVDVAAPGWRVLHMSRHALDRTGIALCSQDKENLFWSMFSLDDQSAPWTVHADAVKHRRFFSVKGVYCNTSPSERLNLIFRPAKSDCLAKVEQRLGVSLKATLAHGNAPGSLYMVMVCTAGSLGTQRASPLSEQRTDSPLGQGARRKMCCIHEDRPMGHMSSCWAYLDNDPPLRP
ncbi:g22 [Coccomyxa viridis]|uniref:G22 protein n=1 Tax=Coccomyxa viridis TaxID=1274662 RepID=A0ABP1FIU9_9CHLO